MTKNFSLYIHIPFCKKKCNYCDFYSKDKSEYLIDCYLDSIEKEIKYLDIEFTKRRYVKTLYFGGGTPSILTSKQVKKVFDIVINNFNLSYVEEINFEVNPESFDEEKLSILLNCSNKIKDNVLRISVGIQSFDNKILNIAGRVHNLEHIFKILNIIKKNCLKNYSLDYIFGFKEQDIKSVENDILEIKKIFPPHISCYSLSIEKNTKFYQIGYNIDTDLQAQMYDVIVENLAKNGYNRYEISNFALEGFESKHNLNYWNYGEYLGLGCSAVSFYDNKRIKNISNIEEYIEEKYSYEEEILSEEQKVKEKIMLGLRTIQGVSLQDIDSDKYGNIVKKLVCQGYLVIQNDRIKIDPKYMFLSNAIISEFF